PTYRGLGGLYNGLTTEGLPIEAALSGPMLQRDPALCWKYLAQLGEACLNAAPNAGHEAIAELQRRKPDCWVLTQNIDGYHRRAGPAPTRGSPAVPGARPAGAGPPAGGAPRAGAAAAAPGAGGRGAGRGRARPGGGAPGATGGGRPRGPGPRRQQKNGKSSGM